MGNKHCNTFFLFCDVEEQSDGNDIEQQNVIKVKDVCRIVAEPTYGSLFNSSLKRWSMLRFVVVFHTNVIHKWINQYIARLESERVCA